MKIKRNQQQKILDTVRRSIEYYFDTKKILEITDYDDTADANDKTDNTSGFFVVLKKFDTTVQEYAIRGMSGTLFSAYTLDALVPLYSVNAAFFDHKVPRLKPFELNEISVSVILVAKVKDIPYRGQELRDYLEEEHPGVIALYNGRESYLFPSVWSSLPEAEQFLRVLLLQLGAKVTMVDNPQIIYKEFEIEEFSEN